MKILSVLPFILIPLSFSPIPAVGQTWQQWVKQNSQAPAPSATPAPTYSAPQVLPTPQNSPAAQPAIPANQLSTNSPLFKSTFMQGCVINPSAQNFCACVLENIQNSYTFEEVVKISEYMQQNQEFPSEIYALANACRHKI